MNGTDNSRKGFGRKTGDVYRPSPTPELPKEIAVNPPTNENKPVLVSPAPVREMPKEPLPLSPRDLELRIYSDSIAKSLWEALDVRLFASADDATARAEIRAGIQTIIEHKNYILSPNEVEGIIRNITNEVLGLGPLECLLERDDIADIMVNGPDEIFIEVGGRIEKSPIRFRNNQSLMNVCTRIVGRVGRRVDESSPICDARLEDGSRVNVIIPPLSLKGPILTIRKFKREKLTLDKLMAFGSLDEKCAQLLQIIAACRVNVLVSGGTGSGKTTLLNCLTKYIDPGERVITCEDAAELQLQQPHVVTLETRNASAEGAGEVSMRDLVRNCLRMRPERIIVGEVRGSEAFDLLQAMNTGHDGSMGTLHANNPRDAIARLENMIAMANLNIPANAVREQIASAIDVIVQVQRLKDGSRKVTHITELVGMENDVALTQDLMVFKLKGEENGRFYGEFKTTGYRPGFFDKVAQYGLDDKLMEIMAASDGRV